MAALRHFRVAVAASRSGHAVAAMSRSTVRRVAHTRPGRLGHNVPVQPRFANTRAGSGSSGPAGYGFFDWCRDTILRAPSHLLAGIALGGFTSTTGATLWYLQSSGKIDLRPHLEKMDKIKVKADCEGEHYFIPLPLVIPLVTWTVAVLWTTTRAFYRSRLDYALKNFFHSVTFTLCARQSGRNVALAQRRVMEKSLDHIVYENNYIKGLVKNAAGVACRQHPVLRMPAVQASLITDTLRGTISRVNGAAHIALDQGGDYREVTYWFALTKSDANLRVLLMSEATVEHLAHVHCLGPGSIGAGAGSVCTPPSPLLPMLDTRNPYATGAVKDAVRMITTSSEYHSYKSSPGCPATAAEPPPTEVPVIGSVQMVVAGKTD